MLKSLKTETYTMHQSSKTQTIFKVEVFSNNSWRVVLETDERSKAETHLAGVAEKLQCHEQARIIREVMTITCDYDLLKQIDA